MLGDVVVLGERSESENVPTNHFIHAQSYGHDVAILRQYILYSLILFLGAAGPRHGGAVV
jgi:hypothetical protein